MTDSLQILSSRAGRALVMGGATAAAGDDLAWAWFNLSAAGMGRTIVERLGHGQMDGALDEIFKVDWNVLEVAAMSLAFEDVMTALDLCCDAVFLACGVGRVVDQKSGDERHFDLGQLRGRQRSKIPLNATPSVQAWIGGLLGHQDLALLEACRHALAHRLVRRHMGVTIEEGRPSGRALTEITTLHGPVQVKGRGSIGVLIPRLVGFGEDQLHHLCEAVLADFPSPA